MPGNCSPYKRSSSPNRSELIFCLSCNQETQIQNQRNKSHNSRSWSVYIFTNCCYSFIVVLWLPPCPPWLNYFWLRMRLPQFFGAMAPRMSHFHAYPPRHYLRSADDMDMYPSVSGSLFIVVVVVVVVVFHELPIGSATRDMRIWISVPLLFCTTYIFRTWDRSCQ